jgi:CRISPR-associated protein Cmr1
MEIKIRTLTPIWTGDVDRKCSKIEETGIVGSLRWWIEAILRSMDKYACDPTSSSRCPKEEINQKPQYCPACLIFGASGIRRMFRLDMRGGERMFNGGMIKIKPRGRKRGWYLGSGITGKMKLSIIPLDKDFDENLILTPLIIASKWGGIGAKTQHGYGVVELEDYSKLDFYKFKEMLGKITNANRLSRLKIEERQDRSDSLPNLREMFFTKSRFEVNSNEWWKSVNEIAPYINDQRMTNWINSGSVPITPAIKNWLRYKEGTNFWKTNNQNIDGRIENWLFGTTNRVCAACYKKVGGDKNNPRNFWCQNCKKSLKSEETLERIASKINISCIYKVNENLWELRIWGWIPKNGSLSEFNRENFLNELKNALNGSGSVIIPWNSLLGNQTQNHRLILWREFDSQRDTIKPNENNFENYLQSLLSEEGVQ